MKGCCRIVRTREIWATYSLLRSNVYRKANMRQSFNGDKYILQMFTAKLTRGSFHSDKYIIGTVSALTNGVNNLNCELLNITDIMMRDVCTRYNGREQDKGK